MNARWIWIALVLLAAGCPMTVSEEVYPPVSGQLPLIEADRPVPYEQFLVLMDGPQRQAFFELRTTAARERFLQEHGLTVKRMLADNLQIGMRSADVQKLLGRPPKAISEESGITETSRYPRIVDEWWVYQRPDTGLLVFIPFRKGWVVDWLVEPEVRKLLFDRADDDASRKKKEKSLIHIGDNIPSLLRNPGEDREDYVERMKTVAPVLFSKGPPSWPEPLPLRKEITALAKSKIGAEEVYSWWGNTAKLYETPETNQPPTYYRTSNRWTYKIFNGFGFTYYSLLFLDDRLAEWDVETDVAR